MTGTIGYFFFSIKALLLEWLHSGAKLSSIGSPTHFGLGKKSKPGDRISNGNLFSEYLERSDGIGELYARDYRVLFRINETAYSYLFFWNEHRSVISQSAYPLTCELARAGSCYSFLCEQDEHRHRNYHGIDIWGNGKLSGGFVGMDLSRYLPGLYWLNYWSHNFARERTIPTAAISELLGGKEEPCEFGGIIKLFDEPEQWQMKRDLIDTQLGKLYGFFSKSQIPPLPTATPSPIECSDYITTSAREWP